MTEPIASQEQRVRTLQIVAGAIIGGAIIFLVIAAVLKGGEAFERPDDSPILSYVLVGVGAFLVVASQVAPGMLTAAGRRKILQSAAGQGNEPLLALYQQQLILGLALAEAAAFLVIIAFLIEGQPVSLIAAVLFVGFMVAHFPTARGVNTWLADQSELLQRE